ncbi:MAG: NTP transferase domain-containing protein [Candidatus Kerfeldbacteria bacterium]|nr:NTP transferase domain-containing protein [Candidatus Kerfeldbacteria bacterium]
MIRTIVLAAAGRGTRMKHLAQNHSKHLVEIAGRPFFYYTLSSIRAAGFQRIIVVVGHHAARMREFLSSLPYPVEVVDQAEVVGEKYGTASVVEAARHSIGEQSFVYQMGDWVYTPEVYAPLRVEDGFCRASSMPYQVPHQFGIVEQKNGWLKRIVEQSSEPGTYEINNALYSFTPAIFPAIDAVVPSPRGEYEIPDAINALAAQHLVKVVSLPAGAGIELGKPEDLPLVEQFIQEHFS